MELPAAISGNKKIIIPVVLAAAGFVAWRYYQARGGSGDDATDSTISDGEFGAVDSSVPGVMGAVSPTNSYGSDTGNDDDGSAPTTNAGWSQQVISNLQQSDKWTYTDITTAIGNYLGSQPLSTDQQAIVRAAIAVGGYPPVGTFSIISGGNTSLTVAPTNVHVQSADATSVTLAFNTVSGAASYRAYRGVGGNVASSNGSPIVIRGLSPNTSYTFTVAGVTAAGTTGPSSAPVNGKTKAISLAKPGTPTVSAITKTSVKASTSKVTGADGYRWYLNGTAHGYSEGTSYTLTGLKPNTTYGVSVAADLAHQTPGPQSARKSFKTTK